MKAGRTVRQRLRPVCLPGGIILLTLAIFALVIHLVTLQLRDSIRRQIVGRDGEILHAVAVLWQTPEVLEEDEEDDLLSVVLKTSRLKGVIAARLYDAEANLIEPFPYYVTDGELDPRDLPYLREFQPLSHFHAEADLAAVFLTVDESREKRFMPLLEVLIPLHSRDADTLEGIAQFYIEGESIAAEFAALDRRLFLQAAVAFAVGGTILFAILTWAFRRVQSANRKLRQQAEDLLRANQELTLAAKTAALGSVAAHLIHGLKNPLAGLRNLTQRADEPVSAEDLELVAVSARRMQSMIDEVIGVLREEEGALHYELTLEEMVEAVTARLQPQAREKGVILSARVNADGVLTSRAANLAILILSNLVQNALQATPRGRKVELELKRSDEKLVCEVRDEGSGIDAEVMECLFAPMRSRKEGGSGIGLAISRQLALHLGAQLELRETSPLGSVFALTLPGRLLSQDSDTAPEMLLQ